MRMPSGIVASTPRTSTHTIVEIPAAPRSHHPIEQEEARDQDHQHHRDQAERVEEQLTRHVADHAVGSRLRTQQGAVLPCHSERVGGTRYQPERDQRAEDAGQRDLRQKQVGALDLGVAPKEQVAERCDRHEEVRELVLRATKALYELRPAALEADSDRVSLEGSSWSPPSSGIAIEGRRPLRPCRRSRAPAPSSGRCPRGSHV